MSALKQGQSIESI